MLIRVCVFWTAAQVICILHPPCPHSKDGLGGGGGGADGEADNSLPADLASQRLQTLKQLYQLLDPTPLALLSAPPLAESGAAAAAAPHIADVVFCLPTLQRRSSEYLMDTVASLMLHVRPQHVLVMKTGESEHPEYEAVLLRYPNLTAVEQTLPPLADAVVMYELPPAAADDPEAKMYVGETAVKRRWRMSEARDFIFLLRAALRLHPRARFFASGKTKNALKALRGFCPHAFAQKFGRVRSRHALNR